MSEFRKVGESLSSINAGSAIEYYDSGVACPKCSAPILAFLSPQPISWGPPIERQKECDCEVESKAKAAQDHAEYLLRVERESTHNGFQKRLEKAMITIPQTRQYGGREILNVASKREALELAIGFRDEAIRRQNTVGLPGFALYGRNGVGKSHIAYAIAEYMNKFGVTTCVTTLIRIASAFRNSFADGAQESSARIIQDLATIPVLILDDFGKEQVYSAGSGEFIQSALFEVVDQRLLRELPIVVTSNKAFEELRDIRYKGNEWGKGLLDRIFESMGSDPRRWCEVKSKINHRTGQAEY